MLLKWNLREEEEQRIRLAFHLCADLLEMSINAPSLMSLICKLSRASPYQTKRRWVGGWVVQLTPI